MTGCESYIQHSFETKQVISDHGRFPNVFLKDLATSAMESRFGTLAALVNSAHLNVIRRKLPGDGHRKKSAKFKGDPMCLCRVVEELNSLGKRHQHRGVTKVDFYTHT